eukprot:TRINITY_DN5168_c0_g1_i10.p1 TRINITY_DN5168_c0_g1~~TRINITY_DN5168_c0_g1_i10.p1  ORF type:complete len:124 (-),score=12.47 TRINITY_DN5168_c0_g1_i10:110-481(-)
MCWVSVKNEKRTREYDIPEVSPLIKRRRFAPSINIQTTYLGCSPLWFRVRMLTGKLVKVGPFFQFTTISDVKVDIQEKEGIPTHQQRLVFKGRGLADEKTVGDYGLSENDLIHLVLTLVGGSH